jgi:hypothetical protein
MDITALNLDETGTVALRKLARELGLKGMSSAKGADLRDAIRPIQAAQIAEAAEAAAKVAAAPVAKKGSCDVCGIRRADRKLNGQCEPCWEEGGWENTHSDSNHEGLKDSMSGPELDAEIDGCWICFPELNRAKRPARAGVVRIGQVIVAKGTEVHKSQIFKTAAEATGWTVSIQTETYEDGNTRTYATATKGTDSISLAWEDRSYDYPNSSAILDGKSRKIRNLKEALRVL